MALAFVAVALFGLAVGSFLNVCIYRMPRGESVVFPRSHCPHCKAEIRFRENIPVFSYLFLRGRCSRCSQAISGVYPAVELLTAFSFLLLFWKYGWSPPFFVNLLFFSLLIILVFVDLFERILPNAVTLGGLVCGLLLAPWQSPEFLGGDLFVPAGSDWTAQVVNSLLGIVVGGGFLWLVAQLYLRLRKMEGMGLGDVKMMGMVGAFLGWKFAWLTIFVGSLIGAVAGTLFILIGRRGRLYALPFGSFLGIGAILVTLWGATFLAWYFSHFADF